MIETSRRTFLGGLLSLLAVETFVPPVRAQMGNRLPRIFGDGRNYDSEGFQALFDGKDVLFPTDKIGIRKCEGVIFHRGTFVIDREVYVTGRHSLIIEQASFDGTLLQWWEAFFTLPTSRTDAQKIIGQARWKRSEGDMAIDIGRDQYSIQNIHMSQSNRFRPKAREDL